MQTPQSVPARIARLPRDRHGYPIPWFVHIRDDGTPDFRVVRRGGIGEAVRFERCWVCGGRRGANAAFVVGPMCGVNRISAEPPAHRDCAIYSATSCPFLANPAMRRRERGLPEDYVDPPGQMVLRNPGATLVWITRRWRVIPVDDGVLFEMGDAEQALWYAHGREASRSEVLASLDSGMPILLEAAKGDGDVADLYTAYARLLPVLPAPPPDPHTGRCRDGLPAGEAPE